MNSKTLMLAAGIVLAVSGSMRAQADDAHAARDKKFAETLSGVSLVGFHTDSTKPAGKLTEERYSIRSVSKLKDDYWLFKVRIKYGTHDVTLPLSLQVKWAGDTPVITLTDLDIPLLGKFSARVVIYDGSYAGTWSGAKHGGHLFGKIEKEKAKSSTEKKSADGGADAAQVKDDVIVKLDKNGIMSVGGTRVSTEELKAVLKKFVAETSGKGRIILDPDSDIRYQHTIKLIQIVSLFTNDIRFYPDKDESVRGLNLRLELDEEGKVRVDGKPVAISDLSSMLNKIVNESDKQVEVEIGRHPKCSFDRYLRVMMIVINATRTEGKAISSPKE